jgi:steroid delta-isomerase
MATRDEIRAVCDRYVEACSASDVDAVVSLFADDAWVEDPVGSERRIGLQAITESYRQNLNYELQFRPFGPVIVVGSRAAFQIAGEAKIGEGVVPLPPTIEVMSFDSDGRIVSLEAYYEVESPSGD